MGRLSGAAACEQGGPARLGSVELGRIPGEDSSKFWFFEFQKFSELGEILQGDLE
jgi:hypothetical protein